VRYFPPNCRLCCTYNFYSRPPLCQAMIPPGKLIFLSGKFKQVKETLLHRKPMEENPFTYQTQGLHESLRCLPSWLQLHKGVPSLPLQFLTSLPSQCHFLSQKASNLHPSMLRLGFWVFLYLSFTVPKLTFEVSSLEKMILLSTFFFLLLWKVLDFPFCLCQRHSWVNPKQGGYLVVPLAGDIQLSQPFPHTSIKVGSWFLNYQASFH
jgi:hypothetical protein